MQHSILFRIRQIVQIPLMMGFLASALLALLLGGCGAEQGLPSQNEPFKQEEKLSASTWIPSEKGGVVQLKQEVTLAVPAHSLEQSAKIQVTRLHDYPKATGQGYRSFGQGYRFTPAGTSFSLQQPARLTLKIDTSALLKQGLSARSLRLFYFNESRQRFVSVASTFDAKRSELVAWVEHFTVYVPMATTLQPGNNAPKVQLQDTVPRQIRAGAPIYVRATVTDFDSGGALSSVRLYFRKGSELGKSTPEFNFPNRRKPGDSGNNGWFSLKMKVVPDPERPNTFAALIPASFLRTTELKAGPDLEYFVEAIDNLGARGQSTTVQADVTDSYKPDSLTISPNELNIAAGFTRSFSVKAQDNNNKSFVVVPEQVSVEGGIGKISTPGSTGFIFSARVNGVGSLKASFGQESASATVSVFNGHLAQLQILDQFFQPFKGTFNMLEGHLRQLHVVGVDEFGNQINVNPTWQADASIGSIDTRGKLYTLDGQGPGKITATVGDVTATQWINVQNRVWQPLANDSGPVTSDTNVMNSSFLNHEGKLYIAQLTGILSSSLSVLTYSSGTWSKLGASLHPGSAQAADKNLHREALAFLGNTLCLGFVLDKRANVKCLQNGTWQSLGGDLNIDSNKEAKEVTLKSDGSQLYAAFREGDNVYVRQWDGTQWNWLGGAVNVGGKVAQSVSLVLRDKTPCVAVGEGPKNIDELSVRCWDGQDWGLLGGKLSTAQNYSSHFYYPTLASHGQTLYISWMEFVTKTSTMIFVSRWDGNQWSLMSSSPSDGLLSSNSPSLGFHNGTLYVAFSSKLQIADRLQLYIRHWNGKAWKQDGEPVVIGTLPADLRTANLQFSGATPVVSLIAQQITKRQMYVRRYTSVTSTPYP